MIEPFRINVDEAVLDDLRARIRNTRWPNDAPSEPWAQGTDLTFLRDLTTYWADAYDWRAHERDLNSYPQFRADLDGVRVHFVHVRAKHGDGVPLILTHGWPSAYLELLPVVPLLTDPGAHGIDGPAFDVVIPSLPGYGFSDRPAQTGVNYRYNAALWHRLMRELGYERYGAQGGDFGAGVATVMALDDPAPVIGVHLSTMEMRPYTGEGTRPITEAEQAYLTASSKWDAVERGYSSIQSTKPQTLGYALNDSPVGLAAWILEKYHSWTDSGGDPERLPRDYLLTLVTLYWVTQTITPSMRDYWDNRWTGITFGPNDFVSVPTAIAGFDNQFAHEGNPPREWAERLYNVARWTPMPRGGHFAAVEEPELFARDVAAFFASL